MSSFDFSGMQNKISQAAEARNLDGDLAFKLMFGRQCANIGGRIFASLSNIGLALKLAPAAQDELLTIAGAKRLQYELDSPPSKQCIVVPADVLADAEAWNCWFGRSVDFVATLLAPKPKVKRK